MMLQEGNLQFDFIGAIQTWKVDASSGEPTTCHGLSHCMKAVDFIVEYDDHYRFVEVKNPPQSDRYASIRNQAELLGHLVGKFRDTFLYRWAENKLDKPVDYRCLVEVDSPLLLPLNKVLRVQLPAQRLPARWQRPLARDCSVANLAVWNKSFPDIPVRKISGGGP